MSQADPLANVTSMVEVLRRRASATPDDLAFCFLLDGEEEGPRLTYADLDRQARAVAAALQDAAGPGDRALLLYVPGLDFIPAFFGCLYAGIVPVPAYPPRLDHLAQSLETLGNIATDCQPRVVLTSRNVAAMFGGQAAIAPLAGLHWCCTDALDPVSAEQWRPGIIDPDALALLQYTSGSTASPKGVRVTHRNLIHNQQLIRAADGCHDTAPGVCWLPLYHDMGLLGAIVQSVSRGTPCMVMSPLAMLQKPVRWLQGLSRYKSRISGGPNLAYQLCVERVTEEQKAGLDLSNWSVAVVGGEPIDPRTVERFTAAFAPCGFRPEAFSPCYGLAEATLFVTGRRPARPRMLAVRADELEQGRVVAAASDDPGARWCVSCGQAWLDTEVVIAHPDTLTTCPIGTVGEIWVGGPSVADGYWAKPDESEYTFRAFLKDTGRGPYLRTGDLGFLDGGELFVTGRLKDMLKFHGRNHYPQDIEQTVQTVHPVLRVGCSAAFETWRDGKPLLVVVQEVERRCRDLDVAALLGDVRQAVAERHGLHVHDLQLLQFGSIPKTTSGKVQRHRCRLGYEQGSLRAWKRGPA